MNLLLVPLNSPGSVFPQILEIPPSISDLSVAERLPTLKGIGEGSLWEAAPACLPEGSLLGDIYWRALPFLWNSAISSFCSGTKSSPIDKITRKEILIPHIALECFTYFFDFGLICARQLHIQTLLQHFQLLTAFTIQSTEISYSGSLTRDSLWLFLWVPSKVLEKSTLDHRHFSKQNECSAVDYTLYICGFRN